MNGKFELIERTVEIPPFQHELNPVFEDMDGNFEMFERTVKIPPFQPEPSESKEHQFIQNQQTPSGENDEQKGDLNSIEDQETDDYDLIVVSPTVFMNSLMNSPKTEMRIEKKAAEPSKKKIAVPQNRR